MYVYDALSKVRSDIEKRKKIARLKAALVAGGLGTLATALGFFLWLGLILMWQLVWM